MDGGSARRAKWCSTESDAGRSSDSRSLRTAAQMIDFVQSIVRYLFTRTYKPTLPLVWVYYLRSGDVLAGVQLKLQILSRHYITIHTKWYFHLALNFVLIQIQYLILMHLYLGQVMRVNPTLYVILPFGFGCKRYSIFINKV